MADTVGEAYVKVVVDSRGIDRGVRQALTEAGAGADKAGEDAGKDFSEGFGREVEDRLQQADVGKTFGDNFRENMDKILADSGRMSDETVNNLRGQTDALRDLENSFASDKGDRFFRDSETGARRLSGAMDDLTNDYDRFQQVTVHVRTNIDRTNFDRLGTGARVARRGILGLASTVTNFGREIVHFRTDLAGLGRGLLNVGYFAIGFTKILAKAALLLGPLAAGLSTSASALTAFTGSLVGGAIGGLAAFAPLALAGAAGMVALTIGLKGFSKQATAAQKAAIKPLTDGFKDIQTSVRGALFSNITNQVKGLLPIMAVVKSTLTGVATAVSQTGTAFINAFGSGRVADNFKTLGDSLAPLTRQLGQVGVNLASGFTGVLTAALPVARQLAGALVTLTTRFAAFASSTSGQTALSNYFERGYVSASKIMTILGTLGRALFKVLNIGDQTAGQSMLDGLLKGVQRFDNYVSSSRGIADLKQWFNDGRAAATSLGNAVKSLGGAFDALDTDQTRVQFVNIVNATSGLITGFGNLVTKIQGLTGPMSSIGSSAGDAWGAIKNLASTIANLFSAIGDSGATTVLSTAFNLIATAANAASGIIGALTPVVKALATAFAALPGPIQSTVASLLILQRIGVANTIRTIGTAAATAAGGRGIGGLARGLGTSFGARIITGIKGVGAAFGPVGLAVGALAIGLGILSSRQKSAAQAAAEHKAEVDALFKSMQASGGAMNNQVKATAANIVAQKGLFNAAKNLGISEQTALGIALGSTKARQQLGAAINKQQQAVEKLGNAQVASGTAEQSARNEQQKSIQTAANNRDKMLALQGALTSVNKSLTDAQGKWLATAQAQALLQNATAAVNPLIQDLTKQMQTFADTTQTAATRTDAFASALLELDDRSMSTQQAALKAADANRALQSQFGKTKDAAGNVVAAQADIRKAFDNGSTFMNTSKAASQLDQTLRTQTTPAFASVVRAAFDAAGGVKNLGPATEAASKAASNFDVQLQKQLVAMGLTTNQAQALIQQYHLMPTDVSTILKLVGGKATEAEMQAIINKSKDVTNTPATVKLAADATNGERTIVAYQARIDAIKQGKVPGLAANSAAGRRTVSDLQSKIDAIRQKTATALRANPSAANAVASSLQTRLNSILQKYPTALKANSSPAHNTAVALQAEINRMKAEINVGADLSPANADVSNWHPPPATMKVYADISKRYASGGAYASMAGRIVDRPMTTRVGEMGYREAIVPLDLPLSRVNPEVRGMAAALRGQSTGPTRQNTINVYPQAADPEAVSWSLLNKLTVLGR